MTLADEVVAAGVTDDDLLEVGLEELSQPAGEVGFFKHEPLVGGVDGVDLRDEFLQLGGKPPPFGFAPLIIKLGEDAVFGVDIQPEPGYGGSVFLEALSFITNLLQVVVNVYNNLADTWRRRICPFNESLNGSIHQVARFSIYQEPTAVGAVGPAIAVRVTSRRWLTYIGALGKTP